MSASSRREQLVSVSKSVFLDDEYEYQTALSSECINFTINFNANGEWVIFSGRRRQRYEEKGGFYSIHADVKLAKLAA